MKTKHILYLYLSLLAGYCTTEFTEYNFWLVYIGSALLYWLVLSVADTIGISQGLPLISTEKRVHRGKREVGGDIARTIAVILVPVVHFFGLTYYYSTPFDENMIFPTAIRWLGICAVPLFMIISGYFKVNAKADKKHYFAIIPLLFTHIFISGIRIWVDYKFHNVDVDMSYIADKMLYFDYGWYIRLYIGMLLLMPFFNTAYKSIQKKWQKEAFILTLIGLNALGPLTADVVPSSWNILYVFGYYIIGCYLSEYKVKVNPIFSLMAFCGILALISFSTYYHCEGNVFDWNFTAYQLNSGYSSMTAVFLSMIIMVMCLNIDFRFRPLRYVFKAVSLVSLEMYLFSQMFDGFIYKDIIENNVPFAESFRNIFVLAGSSIALAFCASWIKKLLFMPGHIVRILLRRKRGEEV